MNHGGQPHEAKADGQGQHSQEASGKSFHDKLLSGVSTGRVGRQRPAHLLLRMSRGYGCLLRTGRTESEIAREALRRQIAVPRFRELRSKTLLARRRRRSRYRRRCVPRPLVRVFPAGQRVRLARIVCGPSRVDSAGGSRPRVQNCPSPSAAARRLRMVSASDTERGIRSAIDRLLPLIRSHTGRSRTSLIGQLRP